ncbi:cytochrome P450 [Actinomadura craniellae]|uniref:Cytochrome P450 n=1 Tax=Actinomadura craniellae TaxID=2231787 RepID=A0A365HDX0_9ACTN|nr:cytochrome P450 [Actinomadura craniellae]RAY17277.1 cytochrome P450 [Actinomadura craniellae]
MTSTRPPFDEIDISSEEFWAQSPDHRDKAFAVLRQERPVSWHRPLAGGMVEPTCTGFWAVVRHEDIVTVSRNPRVFSSAAENGGVGLADVPPDTLKAMVSILVMDDPEHLRQRKLISSVFTPRRVAMIEGQIRAQARRIVADLASDRTGAADFVDAVSKRLPMWTISEMLGVPEQLREVVAENGNTIAGCADDEYQDGRSPMEVIFDAILVQRELMTELMAARRAEPRDDLITELVHAEIEGERLTDDELHAFLLLLCLAGNDTTRHTTSLTMKALTDFPDQRALLLADLPGRLPAAVDEFLRWSSTVQMFSRTVLEDVELNGRPIAAGDRVVVFYPSGNRDEEVFTDPHRFDVTRTPNPHIAFGGGGPHYCLGSHLARTQLHAIFTELLTRLPDLRAGEPEFVVGNAIRGVKRMPCTFTPTG